MLTDQHNKKKLTGVCDSFCFHLRLSGEDDRCLSFCTAEYSLFTIQKVCISTNKLHLLTLYIHYERFFYK
jgi:hypothetical protein